MKDIFILFLFSLYTICEFLSYIPQIIKLLKTKKSEDLSLLSWGIWLTSSCSYLLYVIFTTPNIGLILMGAIEILFCLVIFCLTKYYKR